MYWFIFSYYDIAIDFDFNQLKDSGQNMETTVMALVYCIFDLGVALGGWVGGNIYQEKGASKTFQCMTYFAAFVLCLYYIDNIRRRHI